MEPAPHDGSPQSRHPEDNRGQTGRATAGLCGRGQNLVPTEEGALGELEATLAACEERRGGGQETPHPGCVCPCRAGTRQSLGCRGGGGHSRETLTWLV